VLIGKPGSGKTTLIEKLVGDSEFYKDKFNRVIVISPSVYKMDLPIRKSNKAEVFDIEWIFKKIH
jgi:GTPase SAR1 family protein